MLGSSKYIGMYLSFVLLRPSNNTLFRLELINMHVYFLSDTSDGINCCDKLRFELINTHVNIRSDISDGNRLL